MDLVQMIAAVAVVTEFLKAALRKIGVDPTQTMKIVLAVVGSIGVVVYFAVQAQAPLDINLLWTLVQVIAGSVFGYKIAMKFRAKPK